jgi:hypothetical protein
LPSTADAVVQAVADNCNTGLYGHAVLSMCTDTESAGGPRVCSSELSMVPARIVASAMQGLRLSEWLMLLRRETVTSA